MGLKQNGWIQNTYSLHISFPKGILYQSQWLIPEIFARFHATTKLDHTLARKNDSPTWCGVIVVVWCYCGGVVLLW